MTEEARRKIEEQFPFPDQSDYPDMEYEMAIIAESVKNKQKAAEFGYSLCAEEKDKEIERLGNLLRIQHRTWHNTFYCNTTTMTAKQIADQEEANWKQFCKDNNL